MQHAEYPYLVIDQVVDHQIVLMHNQFASAAYPAWSPQAGMIGQAAGLLREQFIQRQGGNGIVWAI